MSHSPSGHFEREKIFATLGIGASDPPARGLVSTQTTLLMFPQGTSK